MTAQKRKSVMFLILPLFVVIVLVQKMLDPQVAEIHKGERTTVPGLSTEFVLGPMLGLQQAVAGLLWVRADEFFHEGDYDAILPMVRMVTWLDPHQLDVYITGGWHLAYNFTDVNERSDRRYIPAAQALLREGAENNDKVYDIYFELGWQNFDKLKDYAEAEKWYRLATTKKALTDRSQPIGDVPAFVWHQLAHAQERQGKIDEAIATWKECLALFSEKLKADPKNYTLSNTHDSEIHNLELTLKRKFSRYVHNINFTIDRKVTKSINMETGEPNPSDSWVSIEQGKVGQPNPPALKPPWDAVFDAKVTFPQDMVMEPRGTFHVANGARVTIRLHDAELTQAPAESVTFNIDQDQTIMQDQHSVRGDTWGRKIDMSKDPKMYGFHSENYYLVFEFDPRATSPFIQDRLGWIGDGMTDKKYAWLNNDTPRTNLLRKVYKLNKQHISGAQPVTEADVVSNEAYDAAMKAALAKARAKALKKDE